MPLLFSYGTLEQEEVQRSAFGRRLNGEPDVLPGFDPALVRIEDPEVATALGRTHHANATFTGRAASRVPGTVFEVTDAELLCADEYEAPFDYRRVSARLASGREAWVYVHSNT